MNDYHRQLCSSDGWASFTAGTMVPAVLDGIDLGDRVLEVGPGYGAGTRALLARTARLTVLERDPELATGLRRAFGDAVIVVDGDATAMPWERATFSAVLCFTMLHHLPSVAAQDRLFSEAARVLRSGGVFAGADSRSSRRFRVMHIGDTCTPIEPGGLAERLQRAGFADVDVEAKAYATRFAATAR
jgi:SAM-dependent methyltransferase